MNFIAKTGQPAVCLLLTSMGVFGFWKLGRGIDASTVSDGSKAALAGQLTGGLIFSALCLLSAWGIFRWRKWGRIIAVILCLIILFAAVFSVILRGSQPVDIVTVSVMLLVVIWLLLPAVGEMFRTKREQT